MGRGKEPTTLAQARVRILRHKFMSLVSLVQQLECELFLLEENQAEEAETYTPQVAKVSNG